MGETKSSQNCLTFPSFSVVQEMAWMASSFLGTVLCHIPSLTLIFLPGEWLPYQALSLALKGSRSQTGRL